MVPDMIILSKHVRVPAICDLYRSRIDAVVIWTHRFKCYSECFMFF